MKEAKKSSLWFIKNNETTKLTGEIDTNKSFELRFDSKAEATKSSSRYTVGFEDQDTSGYARLIY
jgi:hypothetical protein